MKRRFYSDHVIGLSKNNFLSAGIPLPMCWFFFEIFTDRYFISLFGEMNPADFKFFHQSDGLNKPQ